MKHSMAISLVLIFILLCSLAACNGKEEKSETKTPSNSIPPATENGDLSLIHI